MRFIDLLQWTVIAAIAVVLIVNADKVGKFVVNAGNFWTQETAILASGGSYAPTYNKVAA
jgi:hypothetical protein